jgi:hypothetical protein
LSTLLGQFNTDATEGNGNRGNEQVASRFVIGIVHEYTGSKPQSGQSSEALGAGLLESLLDCPEVVVLFLLRTLILSRK